MSKKKKKGESHFCYARYLHRTAGGSDRGRLDQVKGKPACVTAGKRPYQAKSTFDVPPRGQDSILPPIPWGRSAVPDTEPVVAFMKPFLVFRCASVLASSRLDSGSLVDPTE